MATAAAAARPGPSHRGRTNAAATATALSNPSGHQKPPWARPSSTAASSPSSRSFSAIHSAARRSPGDADGRSKLARWRIASSMSERSGPIAAERISLARRMARDPDCLFCKIVAGEIPGTKVAEDERTVAFMDINPATRGHLLVVPRAHARDLLEIDDEDLAACAVAARRLAKLVKERLGADGVNLLNSCGPAAWQTVFHFHIHVIPRYDDDPLRLPWTPAPGDSDEIAAAARELTG